MADQSLIEAKRALLAEWEANRDNLDILIAALRRELGEASPHKPEPQQVQPSAAMPSTAININDIVSPGDFFGMSQVEAMKAFLDRTGKKTASLQELAAALYRGKATEALIEGEKQLKNLSSLLSKTDTVFLSVARGRWGLREWYSPSVLQKRDSARKSAKVNGTENPNGETQGKSEEVQQQ